MRKLNGSKKKRGTKRKAIPCLYKGMSFASKLERSMAVELDKAGIKFKYEEEVFTFNEEFLLENDSYERFMNSKGVYKNRKDTPVNKMFYTPDFTGRDFVIEVKGHPNERFPVVWKLFKIWMYNNNDKRTIYKPQSLKDIVETVRLIKNKRNALSKTQNTKEAQ